MEEKAVLRLIDVTGRTLIEKLITIESGVSFTRLSTTDLPKGVYWLRLDFLETNSSFMTKVIK